MVRRKIALILAGMASLLAGAIAGSLASAGPSFVPAAEGELTYVVSDVSISELAEGLAIVQFGTAWPDQVFPGYVTCRVSVMDDAGQLIGAKDFQYASFITPDSSTIEVEANNLKPTSASVDCSRGEKPSDSAGYVLSDVRVEPQEGEPPHLVFHAQWLTDEPPLYQSCTVDLELPDGSMRTYPFGISVGRSEDVVVLLTDDLSASKPTGIVCAPFVGPDDA